MSDLQLRDWIQAIWERAIELPAELPAVCVLHDSVDMLVEVRGKAFAIEIGLEPAWFSLQQTEGKFDVEVIL
jgi:hypothetical protein